MKKNVTVISKKIGRFNVKSMPEPVVGKIIKLIRRYIISNNLFLIGSLAFTNESPIIIIPKQLFLERARMPIINRMKFMKNQE